METAAKKRNLILYKKQTGSLDFSILLVVTILCAFGLVMVFSASYYYAIHTQNGDGYFYLKKQLMYMAIGYPLMLIMSQVRLSPDAHHVPGELPLPRQAPVHVPAGVGGAAHHGAVRR